MRYGLSLLTALAWALWLGGLMALFILVSDLFKVDRPTAVIAAPRMFLHFERFQLLFAAVALLTTVLWRFIEKREGLIVLFCWFTLAAVALVIAAGVVTPKLEQL